MTKSDRVSSYGLYLQTVRVEKGISIERVSEETRIRAEILRSIEAEDHGNLPNDVFVKGFLGSFARVIGADPEEALRRFELRRKTQAAVQSQPIERRKAPKGRFWITFLWVLILLVTLIGGTLFIHQLYYQKEHSNNTAISVVKEKDTSIPEKHVPSPPSKRMNAQDSADKEILPTPEVSPKTEQYNLEIVAAEPTWLKVIADDARATEHYMEPGETLQFKANSIFNLLIGNAGGVSVQLNGKPVPVQGRSGQVVNLQLP